MEIKDKVTFEHEEKVGNINIEELIEILKNNRIKIDPEISEKVIDYHLKLDPKIYTHRESFVPIGIDTQGLDVVGYILRSSGCYDGEGKLEIELQNSQRGSVMATYKVPHFEIRVESDAESGIKIVNNVRRSLEEFYKKNTPELNRIVCERLAQR